MARKVSAQELSRILREDFVFQNAEGEINFRLRDYTIIVQQNNVVGNIIEEWLAKWFNEMDIANVHNHKQASPDFWLDPDNLDGSWVEVKCFTGSPNFDIGNFKGYINEVIQKPWKLHSDYLLVDYDMDETGKVTIKDFWMKKVWEISSPMSSWPIKVQYRNGQIVNMRPAVWYSKKVDYPAFSTLEHYLAALEETIYRYPETRVSISQSWLDKLKASYKKHYGVDLNVPRWNDIKSQYGL